MNGYGFLKDNLYDGTFPADFVVNNLMNEKTQEYIRDTIWNKYDENVISHAEAIRALEKMKGQTASLDEILDLLHYIFLSAMQDQNHNFFGTETEHIPRQSDSEDDEQENNNSDVDSEREITGWLAAEEDGVPYNNETFEDDIDFIGDVPEQPWYTIDCNEEQLKNRLKMSAFLDLIYRSPFLDKPYIHHNPEPAKHTGREVKFDEEVPF